MTRWRLPALGRFLPELLLIAAVGLVDVTLLTRRLGPLDGFWSGDQGVRLIQVESLLHNRFATTALVYPGARLDPEREFTPLRGQYLKRDGRTYAMFSAAFAYLSSLGFAGLGYLGLYAVPVGSALALLGVCAFLGRRLFGRWGNLAALAVLGLASPLLFYSLVFWEHTTAALLATLAVTLSAVAAVAAVAAIAAVERRRAALLFAAGLAVGAAASFRNEAVLCTPALAAGLLMTRALDLRRLAWLAAGTAAGLLPLMFFNRLVQGTWMGAHVQVAAQATGFGAGLTAWRGDWLDQLLAPRGATGLITLAVLLAALRLAAALPGGPGRRTALAPALALVAAGWVVLTRLDPSLQTSLLMTFPAALLALLPPPPPPEEERPVPAWDAGRTATLLGAFGISYVLLAWRLGVPAGGVQWGPRMLLPALPALALSGLWRAAGWLLRSPSGPARVVLAAATVLLVAAGARSQLLGVRQIRASNSGFHAVHADVAASGACAVVADSGVTASVIAPLFYRGPLVFRAGGERARGLFARLVEDGCDRIYYLSAPGMPDRSPPLPPLEAVVPPHPLPLGFTGAVYRLPGPAAAAVSPAATSR